MRSLTVILNTVLITVIVVGIFIFLRWYWNRTAGRAKKQAAETQKMLDTANWTIQRVERQLIQCEVTDQHANEALQIIYTYKSDTEALTER